MNLFCSWSFERDGISKGCRIFESRREELLGKRKENSHVENLNFLKV